MMTAGKMANKMLKKPKAKLRDMTVAGSPNPRKRLVARPAFAQARAAARSKKVMPNKPNSGKVPVRGALKRMR